MLEFTLIAGLLNTTLLICFKKWGWLELYTIYRKKWMPKADCYLCLSFWLAMLQAAGVSIFCGWQFMLVPFCSCAITNYLTNIAIIHDYNKGR